MKTKVMRAAGAAVVGVALAGAGMVAAHADAIGDYLSNAVMIRTASNTGATAVGQGKTGDKLTATCIATQGESVSGNKQWVRHKNNKTLKKGYSSATLVNLTGSVPSVTSTSCTPAP
jgi:hypothetical protein